VETVNEGWNILLDVSTPNLIDKIESFSPSGFPNHVFGIEVAKKMMSIINSKILRCC